MTDIKECEFLYHCIMVPEISDAQLRPCLDTALANVRAHRGEFKSDVRLVVALVRVPDARHS